MILVDANLLIYAHITAFAQHEVARDWLDQQLNDVTRVGLPWASVLAFLRIVTNPRIFERPARYRLMRQRAYLDLDGDGDSIDVCAHVGAVVSDRPFQSRAHLAEELAQFAAGNGHADDVAEKGANRREWS